MTSVCMFYLDDTVVTRRNVMLTRIDVMVQTMKNTKSHFSAIAVQVIFPVTVSPWLAFCELVWPLGSGIYVSTSGSLDVTEFAFMFRNSIGFNTLMMFLGTSTSFLS